jgi:hypothetical protein
MVIFLMIAITNLFVLYFLQIIAQNLKLQSPPLLTWPGWRMSHSRYHWPRESSIWGSPEVRWAIKTAGRILEIKDKGQKEKIPGKMNPGHGGLGTADGVCLRTAEACLPRRCSPCLSLRWTSCRPLDALKGKVPPNAVNVGNAF